MAVDDAHCSHDRLPPARDQDNPLSRSVSTHFCTLNNTNEDEPHFKAKGIDDHTRYRRKQTVNQYQCFSTYINIEPEHIAFLFAAAVSTR